MATQDQNSEKVLTVTSGVMTAYAQSMTVLLEKAKIYSPYTLVKMGIVGSVGLKGSASHYLWSNHATPLSGRSGSGKLRRNIKL